MKRLLFTLLFAASCITAQATDPFQENVDQQKQAEATAAAAKRTAKRQSQLAHATTPDAEIAAKIEARNWKGDWYSMYDDGIRATGQWKNSITGKLVRVYRESDKKHSPHDKSGGKRDTHDYTPATVEIQSGDGTIWRATITSLHSRGDRDSEAYVKSFLADWEKKHAKGTAR